jgi:hypothetical protein
MTRDVPSDLYGAIDVGAGSGSKIGVFGEDGRSFAEALLPIGSYGCTAEGFADGLAGTLVGLLEEKGLSREALRAIGVACPGLFEADGTTIAVANVPFLKGSNLPELLQTRLVVPVRITNDADAGALAEWSLARDELLYWVFGGGWGGAWVSAEGEVLHPTLAWDGDDASLHYTNEPGYAIPLEKAALRGLFSREETSYERFEDLCTDELKPEGGTICGPSGRTDCVRAELLASGPGRWRIFRSIAETDITSVENISPKEARSLADPVTAGEAISRLHKLGVDAAARTDRLFGMVLAEAADILFRRAERDGCPAGIPVFVAGGPGRALPLFGPSASEAMRAKGITSELRLSRLERDGRNANLLGAAVLAGSAGKVP